MCEQWWPVIAVFARATVFLGVITPLRHALRPQGLFAVAAALALWISRWNVETFVSAIGIEVPRPNVLTLCGAPNELMAISSLLAQCALGACAALPFALAVEGAAMCGRLLDCLRGAQGGEAMAPLSDTALSVNENIFRLAFLAVACEAGFATSAVCSIVGDHVTLLGADGFPLRQTPSLGYLDDLRIDVVLGESLWIAFPFGLSLLMFDLFFAVLFRTASGFGTSLSSWRMLAGVLLWIPMSEALEQLDVGRLMKDHRQCVVPLEEAQRKRTYPSFRN